MYSRNEVRGDDAGLHRATREDMGNHRTGKTRREGGYDVTSSSVNGCPNPISFGSSIVFFLAFVPLCACTACLLSLSIYLTHSPIANEFSLAS